MSKIGLVIGREYKSKVKTKSFVILTMLIPIIAVGLFVLGMYLDQEEEKHYKVLVSDPRDLFESKVFIGQDEEPPATFYFTNEFITDTMFYEQERFQEYDVIVAIDPDVITNKTINAGYRDHLSARAQVWIAKKLEVRLEEYFALDANVPLEKYRQINQGYKFSARKLMDDDCNEQKIGQGVGMGFSIMTFIFMLIYGSMVLRSILEEKTGRVVEIVVSSVKPFELMMGKIIAVGLVGLTQFFIWFVMVFVMLMFIQPMFAGGIDPETMQAGAMLSPDDLAAMKETENCTRDAIYHFINWPLLLGLFVLYFIGGYLLYGSLFAIVGAAADTEADTQQLIIPVLMPLVFVYVFSFSLIGKADSAAAVWGSHIPFSSPIIMLQRVGANTASVWEVIISLIILVLTFIFTTYLAGKVYRTGILMYGKKASWKEIIKWLRH